jgi:ABC-2 type transport system ATP-binding protein
MENVIEVQNLRKVYKLAKPGKGGEKELEAVKDISFQVESGEVFGILGPNGAGKTTTLEIIEGLRPKTAGSVKVLGLDIENEVKQIKQRIGIQLQSSNYLPNLTLLELLQLFQSLYSSGSRVNSKSEIRNPKQTQNLNIQISKPEANNAGEGRDARLWQLLKFVGLEEKAHEQVKNLSGGQKQRFTLATSLVNDPEIIFLDEPTTGLDPKARRDVWRLVQDIKAKGMTVVLTTHYMEEAEFLCDRVAIVDHGKILKIASPKQLINDLAHTTQISFLTSTDLPKDLWEPIQNQIEKIYSQDPKVVLEVKSLDAIGRVVEILKNRNIGFSGFLVRTASLEDVYLDLTGREFAE